MRRLAVPLGIVVFVDVLRVWLPSVITVFGQAASTPTELLGAFALGWFVLGLAGPLLVRAFGPVRVGIAAAVVLAACRLALVGTAGQAQLYVACAGLLAGLVWLATLAFRAVPLAETAIGLASAATEHATLATRDLTWRGAFGWLGAGVVVVLFVASAVGDRETRDGTGNWYLFGPVLFLGLQIGLAPSLVHVGLSTVDFTSMAAGVVVTAASILAFAWFALRPPRYRVASAVALVLGAAAFGYGGGRLLVVAVPVTAAALGACAGLAGAGGPAVPARRAFAAVVGMLGFAVAVFAYYAAYDLGYPNGWVPVLVAAIVGTVAVRRPIAIAARTRWFAAAAVVVLVLVASGAWWTPPAPHPPPARHALRLVTYNIRMAFGLDGRFSVGDIARLVRAERPDVVTLSEVDRGWLLNGGHDDLTLLARAVGMRYLFGPAADNVWGDAILTNLPVVSVRAQRLPADGPTGAQVLGAVLRTGDGEVAVVATHLQPPNGKQAVAQAAAVARFAASLHTPARPVMVAGDFNTQPGEDAFRALQSTGFADGLAASRPVWTSPADAPREQIDHVFLAGATAGDIATPRGTASDHLPVAATVTW